MGLDYLSLLSRNPVSTPTTSSQAYSPHPGTVLYSPECGRCSGLRLSESDCTKFGQVEPLHQGQVYLCSGKARHTRTRSFTQKLPGAQGYSPPPCVVEG